MFNYLFGKQPCCQDLGVLVQKLQAASDKMNERSQCAANLGATIFTLVQSEAPSFVVYFERVKEIYDNLTVNYRIAAQEQNRAIEDLSDIAIRYPLILQHEQERDEVKRAYEENNKKYKEVKAAMKANETQETLMKYRIAQAERAEFATKLIEASELFLEQKRKFNKFVANRSISAWTRFGKSFERVSKEESQLMAALSNFCRVIRENVNNPQVVLDIMEKSKKDLAISDDEKQIASDEFKGSSFDLQVNENQNFPNSK